MTALGVGRVAAIRVLTLADYADLHRILTQYGTLVGWRFRGRPPAPEVFPAVIAEGVDVQAVIVRKDRVSEPVGLVSSYGHNHRDGYTHLAVAVDERVMKTGWPLEGVALFIDYLFRVFPLRKLYVETTGWSVGAYERKLEQIFIEEGCLRDHEWHDGRWWNRRILALTGRRWENEVGPRYLGTRDAQWVGYRDGDRRGGTG